MQEQRSMQPEEFILGRSRHEMQLAPVKIDPPYEKAFYSRVEDRSCEFILNTTAWD